MSNHKPKPLILRIRRPEAYSLIRVPFHTAFCIMSSGFIKNHRKSPYVTLLDSFHLEIHGSSVSQWAFKQGVNILKSFSSCPFWNVPWLICLVYDFCVLSKFRIFCSFSLEWLLQFQWSFFTLPYFHTKPSKIRNLRHIVTQVASGVPYYLKAGLRYKK